MRLVFSSVQSLSRVRLFATPWTAARQASLSITNPRSPPKPMSIESVMLSDYSILCHPLLFLPSIFPSIRVFFSESALCIRWLEYCSFSISPSDEYSGRISFRIDWFNLLAVQRLSWVFSSTTVQKRQFFAQFYGPTLTSIYDYWKNHSFNYTDLCRQGMVLRYNMRSRFVIAFLPRSVFWFHGCSHHPLVLEPQENKTCHCFCFFPICLPEMMGPDAMILSFLNAEF